MLLFGTSPSANDVVRSLGLGREIVGNPIHAWLVAMAIGATIVVAFLLLRRFIASRIRRGDVPREGRLDRLALSVLGDIQIWSVLAVAVFAAAQALVLPTTAAKALKIAMVVAVGLQALMTSRLVVDYGIRQLLDRRRGGDAQPDPSLASATAIIRFVAMLVLGVVVLLLVLDNLGVAITPLVTGLGIGGVAVALAAQSVLSDLFGSLSILLDKPFLVGDFIVIGDHSGTVEHIGVKTTRVRSLSGEQLVFTNSDLLASRIRNFKRMQERRAAFSIGVTYETPIAKLEKIPDILKAAVLSRQRTRFERAHFKSFGAYSLDFETVYFVLAPDYGMFMDIQQAINFEIMRRFAEEGIEFAYPTQVEIVRDGGVAVTGKRG